MPKSLIQLLCAGALLTPISAQSFCGANLVPNGDFETPLPEWTVGSGTGVVSVVPGANVSGTGPSRALSIETNSRFSLRQTQPVILLAQQEYTLRLDLLRTSGEGRVSLELEDAAGNVTVVGNIRTIRDGRSAITSNFTPLTSGLAVLRLAFESRSPFAPLAVTFDNAVLRPITVPGAASGNYPTFIFENRRDFPLTPGPARFAVYDGPRLGFGAVVISERSVASTLRIPRCGENPLLLFAGSVSPPLTAPLNFSAIGNAFSPLTIPPSVVGLELLFQPVAYDPTTDECFIGCVESYVFL